MAPETASPKTPPSQKEILQRARARSEEILATQYETGRKVIERHQWAQRAYHEIKEEYPEVDERDVIRLFRQKREEDVPRIALDVRFLRYNATHRDAR